MDPDDFYEMPEEYDGGTSPDYYFVRAQKAIREVFEEKRESVFYLRQLQVKFEGISAHWVTHHAVEGLFKLGYLREKRFAKTSGTPTRFFYHKSYRSPLRAARRMEEVIVEYSQDHITRSCGHRAEDLFCKALSLRGFLPVAQKVNEFRGRKWEKSERDLDFVFARDGIEYGCEIKNTLGYIEKDEFNEKLEMCQFFGVRPLFIMRFSPWPYNHDIIEQGGFALLFKSQIYDLSQVALVNKIRDVLDLPVDCPRSIPDGIIDRFESWHEKNV